MLEASLTFNLVGGIRSSDRRAVGFLRGHRELDAADAFAGLKENKRMHVFGSMQLWCDGSHDLSHRFHGFRNDSEWPLSYVFKASENNREHRFYGYLYQPEPMNNPRLLLCVLCIHAFKKEHETDRAELARVDGWLQLPKAKDAIRVTYPDRPDTQGRGQILPWRT